MLYIYLFHYLCTLLQTQKPRNISVIKMFSMRYLLFKYDNIIYRNYSTLYNSILFRILDDELL